MFLLAFRDFSRFNAALSHEHNSIAAACGQNVTVLQDGNCPSQAFASFETSGDSLLGGTAPLHKFEPLVIGDRKSTRLNSSHMSISYAVFCLKKKKNKKTTLFIN